MKIILGGKRGGVAIVDKKFYTVLNKIKWHMTEDGYAKATINGKSKYMHRFILKYTGKMVVDHINRNKLDNRESNLRLVTRYQNGQNQSKRQNSTSKYNGVYIRKGKYCASITHNRKKVHLGTFKDEKEAAYAYDLYVVTNNMSNELNFPNRKKLDSTPNGTKGPQSSIYRGVQKKHNKFRAEIKVNNKSTILLVTSNEVDAAKAYDKEVVRLGLSRKLNFPQDYPDFTPIKPVKTLCEVVNDTTVRLLLGTHEQIVTISLNDYDRVKYNKCNITEGYVRIKVDSISYKLHRYLLDCTDESIYVDHINNNPLDNTRDNLRLSNPLLNSQNRSKRKGSSLYLGVRKSYGSWASCVMNNGKQYYIGTCKDEQFIARKRDLFIMDKFPGSHYKLNFEWTEEDKAEWKVKLNM